MNLLERLGLRKTKKTEDPPQGSSKTDKLIFSCGDRLGGGMEGGHESYDLCKYESGRKELTYSRQRYNGDEIVSGEMEPSEELIDKILYIYEMAGVKDYGELEKSDLIALDAPSVSIWFLVNGKETMISDSDVIPERGKGIISSIQETFYHYVFK